MAALRRSKRAQHAPDAALSRFYAIHMLLLPGAIVALIGAHIYLVTRLGITAPPWQKAESGDGIREERV